jgi:hypothetical protein
MGVRFPSVATTTILGTLPSNGAETIIATTPPLTIPLDFAQVILLWYFLGNSGASTSALLFLLRRGTTVAGTLINVSSGSLVTAAAGVRFSGVYVDTPGAVAGQQYSLSEIGVGTTGAGITNDVCLIAFAL